MPQLVKKRRSGWAVLAVGALIASLFAVGATPAAADVVGDDDGSASPSHEAGFSACVGDASEDQGFTDLPGDDTFDDAINCMAHYGVTAGYGDGTYRPRVDVSRWQMDLFMRAAARVAGVHGDDVVGTYASDGADSDLVTRADMAGLLLSLIAEANDEVTINDNGTVEIDGDTAHDHFADARRDVPRNVDNAISAIYELGVTAGTSATEFSPAASVNRGSMAVFITKALGHTNARPAGLTAQADGATIVVSVRDDDHAPVANALVDAFYIDSKRADRAFDDDGECRGVVNAVDDESAECEIDDASTSTNSDGQARVYGLDSDLDNEVTVWVWQGEEADEVDEDTELFEFTVGPLTPPTAHSALSVDPASPEIPLVKFGSTLDIAVQLQATVAGEDVDVAPEKGGTTYVLVTELYAGRVGLATATQKPLFDATSGRPEVSDGGDDLALVRRDTSLLTFNDDGMATFSVTASDPDPSATSREDYRTVVFRLTDNASEGAKGANVAIEMRDAVVFGEESSTVTVLLVTPTNGYLEHPSSGTESNSVTVTALDQYHRPMNNIGVTLDRATVDDQTGVYTRVAADSPNANDDFLERARHTDSTGSVRVSYKKSGDAEVQHLIAVHDPDTGYCDVDHAEHANRADGPDEDAATEDDNCTISTDATSDDVATPQTLHATVIWYDRTEEPTNGNDPVEVLSGSSADGEIVTAGDGTLTTPVLLAFDDNDIFRIGRDGDDAGIDIDDGEIRYVTMGDFEEAVDEVLDPDGDATATLQWEGYDHEDSDERTLLTLRVS